MTERTKSRIERLRELVTRSVLAEGEVATASELIARYTVAFAEAVGIIEELAARLETIQGTLEPIAEVDWHGKWRIRKSLEMCDLSRPFGEKP